MSTFERKITAQTKCLDCGTDEKPHHARGLCKTCYMRQFRKDKQNVDNSDNTKQENESEE